LRHLNFRLFVTWAIACDRTKVEVPSVKAGDSRTEMMIANGFADIEQIDLDAMYFVTLHRHIRSPVLLCAGLCRPVS
jgi:hypothetical protein